MLDSTVLAALSTERPFSSNVRNPFVIGTRLIVVADGG
jgi:hypothetical protein